MCELFETDRSPIKPFFLKNQLLLSGMLVSSNANFLRQILSCLNDQANTCLFHFYKRILPADGDKIYDVNNPCGALDCWNAVDAEH